MDNPLTRKLELFGPLPALDRALLDDVVSHPLPVETRHDLIREGDAPSHVHLVLTGLVCRYKVMDGGRRSIFAYLMPGDFCDLHIFILRTMDHCLATLSPCTIVRIAPDRVLEMFERPALARALWWTTLVDEATLREWLVNLGQRNAESRIAHLFCELHLRLRCIGLADSDAFILPITQADLADTMGLSTVHVNRSLQTLRSRGLITLKSSRLVITDLDGLKELGQFNPNYLHLDSAGTEHRVL